MKSWFSRLQNLISQFGFHSCFLFYFILFFQMSRFPGFRDNYLQPSLFFFRFPQLAQLISNHLVRLDLAYSEAKNGFVHGEGELRLVAGLFQKAVGRMQTDSSQVI